MGITPRFSKSDVNRMFMIKLQRIETVIINRLIQVGEKFVINARNNGNYLDQTGNLRSSIGYIILKNGRTIHENFELSNKGTDKRTGVNKGKSFINQLKANFSTGYVLIVVAGMDYAAAVESRGKDVLTASAITAKNDLQRAISEIKRKVKEL